MYPAVLNPGRSISFRGASFSYVQLLTLIFHEGSPKKVLALALIDCINLVMPKKRKLWKRALAVRQLVFEHQGKFPITLSL